MYQAPILHQAQGWEVDMGMWTRQVQPQPPQGSWFGKEFRQAKSISTSDEGLYDREAQDVSTHKRDTVTRLWKFRENIPVEVVSKLKPAR